MSNKGWVRLRNLRRGAIFETKDGIRAVKTKYQITYEKKPEKNYSQCILLKSGAVAHFPKGDDTWVKEIILPE